MKKERNSQVVISFYFICILILLFFKYSYSQSNYPPGDVSGMFNERGYNRTNSASSDVSIIFITGM